MKSVLLLVTSIVVIHVSFATAIVAQVPAVPVQDEAVQKPDAGDNSENQDEENTQEDDVIEASRVAVQQPGAREMRLRLWDGTVVTGDVGIDLLNVDTQFGQLEVPVKNIISLRPGLDSFPEMTQRIGEMVEKLGDRDFQTREKAHRDLVAMGKSIRFVLANFNDGGSAERKKHLDKIREQIEEMVDEEAEWDEASEDMELIQGDTIITRDFTIVGKILQPEFSLSSKYGKLTIALSDIKTGDRTWLNTSEAINKNVVVKGDSFFQTTPVSTKIRVNKGDRIKIRATGTVQWASWGNISSGPDGITNQGNWQGHNCGTLLARIGNGGEYIKIASKGEFVAKTNGVLYLGISMRDNYARQAGYQWPGEYKTRVSVSPSATEELPKEE